jgi:hypothetical protein
MCAEIHVLHRCGRPLAFFIWSDSEYHVYPELRANLDANLKAHQAFWAACIRSVGPFACYHETEIAYLLTLTPRLLFVPVAVDRTWASHGTSVPIAYRFCVGPHLSRTVTVYGATEAEMWKKRAEK